MRMIACGAKTEVTAMPIVKWSSVIWDYAFDEETLNGAWRRQLVAVGIEDLELEAFGGADRGLLAAPREEQEEPTLAEVANGIFLAGWHSFTKKVSC